MKKFRKADTRHELFYSHTLMSVLVIYLELYNMPKHITVYLDSRFDKHLRIDLHCIHLS